MHTHIASGRASHTMRARDPTDRKSTSLAPVSLSLSRSISISREQRRRLSALARTALNAKLHRPFARPYFLWLPRPALWWLRDGGGAPGEHCITSIGYPARRAGRQAGGPTQWGAHGKPAHDWRLALSVVRCSAVRCAALLCARWARYRKRSLCARCPQNGAERLAALQL